MVIYLSLIIKTVDFFLFCMLLYFHSEYVVNLRNVMFLRVPVFMQDEIYDVSSPSSVH